MAPTGERILRSRKQELIRKFEDYRCHIRGDYENKCHARDVAFDILATHNLCTPSHGRSKLAIQEIIDAQVDST